MPNQYLKEKKEFENCKTLEDHSFGWKTIGGFSGHEHIHPTGEQVCLKCGKTLPEIVKSQQLKTLEWVLKGVVGEDEEELRIDGQWSEFYGGRNLMRSQQRQLIQERMEEIKNG